MRFLCPYCSKKEVVSIECPEGSESASCPRCEKRFGLRAFSAKEISFSPYHEGFLYIIRFERDGRPGIEKFSSQKPLSLQKNHELLSVHRGREVLGIADQTRNRWFPVAPVEIAHPLLYSLLLSLAWPISVLVLIQTARLLPEAVQSFLANPLLFGATVLLCGAVACAPLLLWTMRTLFPYGPGRERIRGYDPRL